MLRTYDSVDLEEGTILGQIDREEAASTQQQTHHRRKIARTLKFVCSVLFTWGLGGVFIVMTCLQLSADRDDVDVRWNSYLESEATATEKVESLAATAGATEVTCGTYLENLKTIDMKDSYYTGVWLVWFLWEDNDAIDFSDDGFIFYNGVINSIDTLEDSRTKDGTRYQQFRVDVTISQTFHTPRFPLENHLLRAYIEPLYDITEVMLRNSHDTDAINRNLNVVGYEVERMDSAIKYYAYDDNHDDPTIPENSVTYLAEHVDVLEINRTGIGLYIKCFIALWGTTLWVLIMLFVATRHQVDVFSMIPGTLFGAVGNILVGANLLPEALTIGLLEYGNIWGIFIVLAGTVTITILNRERFHWRDDSFADTYGLFMFVSILILAIVGNIALPLSSYQLS